MERPADTAAVWSFVLPAAALVMTWFAFGLSYRRDSAVALAGLALLDAAAAAGGLTLVSRSKPCRGWAVAGAATSVLAILAAMVAALLAALIHALSSLTF